MNKSINKEEQNYNQKDILCHILMFLLLVQIIMLYIKNYFTSRGSYTYVIALAVPISLVCLIATDIIYEKYLSKLQKSAAHNLIYRRLLGLLVLFNLSAIAFFVLLSCYLNKPIDLKICGFLSLIAYYLCWSIITGLFIYIFPGLIDPVVNIPRYQVIMAAIYLLFALIFPICLISII